MTWNSNNITIHEIKIGDRVFFQNQGQSLSGIVYVIDKGSIEYPDKTSYDILGDDGVLYKKIFEVKT